MLGRNSWPGTLLWADVQAVLAALKLCGALVSYVSFDADRRAPTVLAELAALHRTLLSLQNLAERRPTRPTAPMPRILPLACGTSARGTGRYWRVLVGTGEYWSVLVSTGRYWSVLVGQTVPGAARCVGVAACISSPTTLWGCLMRSGAWRRRWSSSGSLRSEQPPPA